jgi:hypothetical protein
LPEKNAPPAPWQVAAHETFTLHELAPARSTKTADASAVMLT